MRKLILLAVIALCCTGCVSEDNESEYTRGNMQYDILRGNGSSVVNRAQMDAIVKALTKLNLARYKGERVTLDVVAENDQVKMQTVTLAQMMLAKSDTVVLKPAEDKEAAVKPDYTLELDILSGGYHNYPGIIFNRFESTVRVFLIERTAAEGTARFFDSGYQEARVFRPVLTQEARVSLYILTFAILAFVLYRCGLGRSVLGRFKADRTA